MCSKENINEFQDTVGYFVHLFDALYSPYFMYDETLSNEYFNSLVIWLNGIWKIQQHMHFTIQNWNNTATYLSGYVVGGEIIGILLLQKANEIRIFTAIG